MLKKLESHKNLLPLLLIGDKLLGTIEADLMQTNLTFYCSYNTINQLTL